MTDNTENFNVNTLTSSSISLSTLDGPYSILSNPKGTFSLNNSCQELLLIRPDGTVVADSLESACEAGKLFVESVRHHLPFTITSYTEHVENDTLLNKSEDLHILSKILDAWNDDQNISKAVAIIHAVRKDDRNKIAELEQDLRRMKDHVDSH